MCNNSRIGRRADERKREASVIQRFEEKGFFPIFDNPVLFMNVLFNFWNFFLKRFFYLDSL